MFETKRNSAFTEAAVSQLSYQRGQNGLMFYVPLNTKGHFVLPDQSLGSLLKQMNQTRSVCSAVCPWHLHAMYIVRSVYSRVVWF